MTRLVLLEKPTATHGSVDHNWAKRGGNCLLVFSHSKCKVTPFFDSSSFTDTREQPQPNGGKYFISRLLKSHLTGVPGAAPRPPHLELHSARGSDRDPGLPPSAWSSQLPFRPHRSWPWRGPSSFAALSVTQCPCPAMTAAGTAT